jgi:hypothetical protein
MRSRNDNQVNLRVSEQIFRRGVNHNAPIFLGLASATFIPRSDGVEFKPINLSNQGCMENSPSIPIANNANSYRHPICTSSRYRICSPHESLQQNLGRIQTKSGVVKDEPRIHFD